MFGELPSDLRTQDDTMGPPPSWYSLSTMIQDPAMFSPAYLRPGFYQQVLGGGFGSYELGDREGEIEVNPVEELQDLKYAQEMSKRVPREARRYTTVDPMSPMFRNRKAKFGFGSLDELTKGKAYAAVSLISSVVSGYHGFKRNKGSIGWAAAWFILGGALPIFVPTIAVAQGFGKPAKTK